MSSKFATNIFNNISCHNKLAVIICYSILLLEKSSTHLCESEHLVRLAGGRRFGMHWLSFSLLGRRGLGTEHVLKQRHYKIPSYVIVSAKHGRKVFTKKVYKAPQGSLSGNRRTTRDPFLGDWTAPKIIPAIITCPAIKKYAY